MLNDPIDFVDPTGLNLSDVNFFKVAVGAASIIGGAALIAGSTEVAGALSGTVVGAAAGVALGVAGVGAGVAGIGTGAGLLYIEYQNYLKTDASDVSSNVNPPTVQKAGICNLP